MSDVDRILADLRSARVEVPGLVTIVRDGGGLVAVVDQCARVSQVRQALVELGIPDGALVLHSVDEVLIPYPTDDPMMNRWLKRFS